MSDSATLAPEYYVFAVIIDFDGPYYSALLATPEVDAYLLNHSRRKSRSALSTQLLSANPDNGLSSMTEDEVNSMLNVNSWGRRYGTEESNPRRELLIEHKAAALSQFGVSARRSALGNYFIETRDSSQKIENIAGVFEVEYYGSPDFDAISRDAN